jgi:hypothetical protein
MSKEQKRQIEELLRPLSPEEYAAAPVPTRDQIRKALRKGAEELREMARIKPKGRW